jgi:hypothetical protein
LLPALTLGGAQWAGSKACEPCHAEIYRRYAATPMARTSGPAAAAPVPAGAFIANRGQHYSIALRDGKLMLDFGAEHRELKYFAGSGSAARSYLLETDGFLYEAPATYYTLARSWAPSPGYERYSYPFLTRAIAPACLQCHSTGVQAIEGTQNGFRTPPFLEGGIGCERCHGPGAAHAASGRREDILNPAKLSGERRDSVCAQCHLSGEIRVDRAGKSMADFTPGDRLSDFTLAFVRATSAPGMKVTSHAENLAQSACSRGSAGRLWCGTCHDAHFVPAPPEKAAWFRAKCRQCHAESVCRRGNNCIACHMTGSAVRDADHVVYTDHSIPRRPLPRNAKPPASAPLVAFGGAAYSQRDPGLAYAILALREQNPVYSAHAFDLLREADRQSPGEPQTLAYLADLYKSRGDDKHAEALYLRLYEADPTQSAAPANLGAYEMERGHNEQAIRFFEQALRISPGLVLVRVDLAVALLRTGRKEEARAALRQALWFNPYHTEARRLLDSIR